MRHHVYHPLSPLPCPNALRPNTLHGYAFLRAQFPRRLREWCIGKDLSGLFNPLASDNPLFINQEVRALSNRLMEVADMGQDIVALDHGPIRMIAEERIREVE